jgi:hypothetical protein
VNLYYDMALERRSLRDEELMKLLRHKTEEQVARYIRLAVLEETQRIRARRAIEAKENESPMMGWEDFLKTRIVLKTV